MTVSIEAYAPGHAEQVFDLRVRNFSSEANVAFDPDELYVPDDELEEEPEDESPPEAREAPPARVDQHLSYAPRDRPVPGGPSHRVRSTAYETAS